MAHAARGERLALQPLLLLRRVRRRGARRHAGLLRRPRGGVVGAARVAAEGPCGGGPAQDAVAAGVLVLMHVPWYNTNRAHQGEAEAMRKDMESLLYEARVDVVFACHTHAYERFVSTLHLTSSSIISFESSRLKLCCSSLFMYCLLLVTGQSL